MKLLKITTLLITVLSLTHCGWLNDVVNFSVTDKIECELIGGYKVETDLLFNLSPFDQDYNVNIASGAKDVIVQIESADEDESNMLCTLFHDVKISEDKTKLEFSSSESMISNTNSKSFPDRIDTLDLAKFTWPDLTLGLFDDLLPFIDNKREYLCAIEKLNVLQESSSIHGLINRHELVRDKDRVKKSFETIKKECSLNSTKSVTKNPKPVRILNTGVRFY